MKWFKIDKGRTSQPTSGGYNDWKPLIRSEGKQQCVYCCIHEKAFGGFRNFHVEHYRPKSRFPRRTNSIKNLFYACAICNTFKGADWPGDPNRRFSNASYPDPSKIDFCSIFEVNPKSHFVEGKFIAARYLIEKLYLNRPQLTLERREEKAYENFKEIGVKIAALKQKALELAQKGSGEASKCLSSIFLIEKKLTELISQGRSIAPYDPSDVQRT